ncbi:MAG: PorV/PorQ family protein [Candidatus Zixiibacteriota bacterium]|nr:MAG: PorV/PorQ family protein [candidate division Zixibacteria bacterium]
MFRYIAIPLAALLALAAVVSAEDGDGGYAAPFLQIPVGARPSGMGGAFLAISDDGAAAFFNPAGVAGLRKVLFSTSYRLMDLDRTLGYASLTFPTRGNSALGFSWLYAGSGSVAARNDDGDQLGFDLNQHNHVFSVIFAKRFEDWFAAGFRGSYLHTRFAEMSAFTVSFDLGLMFYFSQLVSRETRDLMAVQDIQGGLVVRNLAATYRWNNEDYLNAHTTTDLFSDQKDRVPLEVGVGGSARFFKRKLVIAADLLKNEHQSFVAHAGAEFFISPQFAARGGYSDKHLTAGTGYVFKIGARTLAIDYAFSTDKVDEGSEHIFSFDMLF